MNKNINFNVGERIHELRIENGLSQEQLALRADITTTYLGLLERNMKNPTIKVIEQICNTLNISLADFFANTSNTYDMDTLSLQIFSQICNRSDSEKKIILQLIKETLKLRDLPYLPNEQYTKKE